MNALEQIEALLTEMRRMTPGDDEHIAGVLTDYADRIDTALQALRDEAEEYVAVVVEGPNDGLPRVLRWCAPKPPPGTKLYIRPAPAAKAVAWQSHHRHSQGRPWSDWKESDQESYEAWVADPQVTWEFRALCVAPPSPEKEG